MQLLFLWENHRMPLPAYYGSVLVRVFDQSRPVHYRRWSA